MRYGQWYKAQFLDQLLREGPHDLLHLQLDDTGVAVLLVRQPQRKGPSDARAAGLRCSVAHARSTSTPP